MMICEFDNKGVVWRDPFYHFLPADRGIMTKRERSEWKSEKEWKKRKKEAAGSTRTCNSCRFLFGELYEVPICLIDSHPPTLSPCVSRPRAFSLSFCRQYESSLPGRTTLGTQSWATYIIRTLPFRVSSKKGKEIHAGVLIARAESNSIIIDK